MQFGISNYMPQDAQKIYDIQAAANSVLPTVFQGNYNAVSRLIEADLFPLLRKLNMSFYAYSPVAGGFLTQDASKIRARDLQGRFNGKSGIGDMYVKLYGGESMNKALDMWAELATDAGISKAALAYRWIAHHSALKNGHGDQIIIGASKPSQLEESLTAIEAGPLEPRIAKRVDDIWETVKHEAPRDNWHNYLSDKFTNYTGWTKD
jgi:aflatoxin B1 aldehyde reductase